MESRTVSQKEKIQQELKTQKLLVEITEEWNTLVLSFIAAKNSWENLKDMLIKLPNLDLLDLSLQRKISQVCITTQFHHAARSFLDLFGFRENIKNLLVSNSTINKKRG